MSGTPSLRKRLLTGVSSNVLILGLVSMLTDMSSEMIYPILPLFLSAIGATGVVIGLIEGAAETTASMLKVVSGWYSDKLRKRKRFVEVGYGLSALTKPVLAIVTSYWQVLGIRVAERVGKGIRAAPRDALIADSSSKEARGAAFGFHKAMDSAGAVIGPLLALPILLTAAVVTTDTYRLIFLVSAVPAIAALFILVLYVKEKEGAPEKTRRHFFREFKKLSRSFWTLMTIVVIFFFGEISYAFFVLKAQDIGLDTVEIILYYVMYNIFFLLMAIPAGFLSDRLGRMPVIFFSIGLFMMSCIVMAIADTRWLLAIGFVLYGLHLGSSEGVMKAFVTDVAPSDLRGTALGAYHTCVGISMLPAGIVVGALWDGFGPWAAFGFGAAMSAASLILLSALKGAWTGA